MMWDGESLDGDRTAVESQVIFAASGSARESALALASLLQGSRRA